MTSTYQARNKNRKRLKRKNASKRRASSRFALPSAWAGSPMAVTVSEVSNYEAVVQYIGAHSLLPFGFDGSNAAWAASVSEALVTIGDASTSQDARLRAIVVLGHTPTPAALDALRRHAESGQELAEVAVVAASECMDWMGWAEPSRSLPN